MAAASGDDVHRTPLSSSMVSWLPRKVREAEAGYPTSKFVG